MGCTGDERTCLPLFATKDPRKRNCAGEFDLRRLTAKRCATPSRLERHDESEDVRTSGSPSIPLEMLGGQSKPGSGWSNSPPDEGIQGEDLCARQTIVRVPIRKPRRDLSGINLPVRFVTVQRRRPEHDEQPVPERRSRKKLRPPAQGSGDEVRKQVAFALRIGSRRQPAPTEIESRIEADEQPSSLRRRALPRVGDEVFRPDASSNLNEFMYID